VSDRRRSVVEVEVASDRPGFDEVEAEDDVADDEVEALVELGVVGVVVDMGTFLRVRAGRR
jgi:hypothetical protein